MFTVIAIIVLLIILAPIVYLVNAKAKKRAEEMQKIGAQMNWNFNQKPDMSVIPGFAQSYLGSQRVYKKLIFNVISGQTNNANVAVFDYNYEIKMGVSSSKQHYQTMVYLQSAALNLPQFMMRPEGWAYKMMKTAGYQDINFPNHPTFSGSYLLQGEHEQLIRQKFNETVLGYFDQNPGLWIEGNGSTLLFYQLDKQVQPQNVQAPVQQALTTMSVFQMS